jgi:acyl carrier protein
MRERIIKVLKSVLGIKNIPDDISQNTCVEWDSMHHLQLVVELEIELGDSIEPDDIVDMKSLDLIEEIIKKLLDS